MLAKPSRVRTSDEYRAVFASGRSTHGRLLTIRIADRDGSARFGIIVGGKVSGKATERNQIRRRIRSAIRELALQDRTGFEAVVIANPSAVGADYESIKAELDELVGSRGT